MKESDYVKLSLMEVNGQEAVEVDVLASKETLTNMIYSGMCNNSFFANAVTLATQRYFLFLSEYDIKAKLN